jgi:hypothetical protein
MDENKSINGENLNNSVGVADNDKVKREEVNYRELRDSKKKIEKERDAMASMLKKYQEQDRGDFNKEENKEEDRLRDDDLVEGKHLTKLGRKFKNLESKFMQQQEGAKNLAIESQLRAKYTDFDKVVSGQNFKDLKEKNPVMARAISSSTDLFAAGALAYEEIVRSGIGITDKHEKDKGIAQENYNKPRPLASVSPQQGESPLSHANAFANGLTPELRKKLRQEMEDARKSF